MKLFEGYVTGNKVENEFSLNANPGVPEQIKKLEKKNKIVSKNSNSSQSYNKNSMKTSQTTRKQTELQDNSHPQNFFDIYSDYFDDWSSDDDEDVGSGFSYLGILSEILTSSSCDSPRKKTTNKTNKSKNVISSVVINKNIKPSIAQRKQTEKSRIMVKNNKKQDFSEIGTQTGNINQERLQMAQEKNKERIKRKEEERINELKRLKNEEKQKNYQNKEKSNHMHSDYLHKKKKKEGSSDSTESKNSDHSKKHHSIDSKKQKKTEKHHEEESWKHHKDTGKHSKDSEKHSKHLKDSAHKDTRKHSKDSEKYSKHWKNSESHSKESKKHIINEQIYEKASKKSHSKEKNYSPTKKYHKSLELTNHQTRNYEVKQKIRPLTAVRENHFINEISSRYNYKKHKPAQSQNQFDKQPKFQLNFRRISPMKPHSLDQKSPIALKVLKRDWELELEAKREKARKIKEERKKKQDFYKETQHFAIDFVEKTKQRLFERKKQEKFDWEKKLYSYSAHKEKLDFELKKKKSYIQELKVKNLDKKKSKILENPRKAQLMKFNEDIKKKHSQMPEKKHHKSHSKDKKEKHHKKLEKSHKNQINSEKHEKSPNKKHQELFHLENARNLVQKRAQEYLDFLKEERYRKIKEKRKRSKKVLKITKQARRIIEHCRKKPFVPKHDFNESTLGPQEDIRQIGEIFEEKENVDEYIHDEYKEMKFNKQQFHKKTENKTKITGKPVKQKQIMKVLSKKDLNLYKYPNPSQLKKKYENEDDEEMEKVEKLINQKDFKKHEHIQNKSSLKIDNVNKVFKDAKLKNVPREILESADVKPILEAEEENVIQKSLRDYKQERNKKKNSKKIEIIDNNEVDELKFMNFSNPIKDFQKEIMKDLNEKKDNNGKKTKVGLKGKFEKDFDEIEQDLHLKKNDNEILEFEKIVAENQKQKNHHKIINELTGIQKDDDDFFENHKNKKSQRKTEKNEKLEINSKMNILKHSEKDFNKVEDDLKDFENEIMEEFPEELLG